MFPFRTVLHLLLAVVLVINGAAGVAMATSMVATLSVATPPQIADHDGCHGSTAKAALIAVHHAGADAAANNADCCAEGRCACTCVHHATLAFLAAPPDVAMNPWPPVLPRNTPAAPGRLLMPALRPPIAPSS